MIWHIKFKLMFQVIFLLQLIWYFLAQKTKRLLAPQFVCAHLTVAGMLSVVSWC